MENTRQPTDLSVKLQQKERSQHLRVLHSWMTKAQPRKNNQPINNEVED